MSGMTGASMLRQRRKDVNLKPNRKLDRKSSRGVLYENEELRLRTININAEVERGQSDIKKLRRENDQLKREISALRGEYDRLERLLRRASPDQDDSGSVCSVCPECAGEGSPRAQVSFHDLSVVPEEEVENRSDVTPCTCDECKPRKAAYLSSVPETNEAYSRPNNKPPPNTANNGERSVDVLVHDAPSDPHFFEPMTSPYLVTTPPPPGFIVAPYHQPSRFKTGGNLEELLDEVQSTPVTSTYVQQNSLFMCNTKKVIQRCCCQNDKPENSQPQKSYVTEKNIELTYDYPRSTPVKPVDHTLTTEVASTVVFVERRIPVKSKKFDFFRSRSAPVGDNEEPIYATVNKLPKRLRRMELAKLEKEVAYKNEADSSRTEVTKTDSEPSARPDDDTSPSEIEKSAPKRPDTPKSKKRKRFSLTFKKRERKRREKKEEVKNGVCRAECESERLIDVPEVEPRHKLCSRHRPRNTLSSSSSGARYKRDSYLEGTTSHSEHERTNSMCSSMNSLASACTHKSRKLSASPLDGAIPWCGCWGAGCL